MNQRLNGSTAQWHNGKTNLSEIQANKPLRLYAFMPFHIQFFLTK
jgi:hypothetical protein